MSEKEALNSIGIRVIARDEYWGTYYGELVNVFRTPLGMRPQVRVLEVIELPKQHAIISKDKPYHRDPYEVGSIHNFDLQNVRPVQMEDRLAG